VGKGALSAVPTIRSVQKDGGHASLCPPYGSRILTVRRRESAVSNHVARLVPFILRDGAYAPPQDDVRQSARSTKPIAPAPMFTFG